MERKREMLQFIPQEPERLAEDVHPLPALPDEEERDDQQEALAMAEEEAANQYENTAYMPQQQQLQFGEGMQLNFGGAGVGNAPTQQQQNSANLPGVFGDHFAEDEDVIVNPHASKLAQQRANIPKLPPTIAEIKK